MSASNKASSKSDESSKAKPSSKPLEKTTVCIVGAGPAGLLLAYILARQSISVTVLEAQDDFDRDFRGDTFHCSAMELMDQLGLSEELAPHIHSRLPSLKLVTPSETLDLVDFRTLSTPHPYVCLIPQKDWLNFIAQKAKETGHFTIHMKARAGDLLTEEGRVVGVEYQQDKQKKAIHCDLVVGADGRSSQIRRAAKIDLQLFSSPMDVLWFQLPAKEGDDQIDPLAIRFRGGLMLISVYRREYWQIGWVIMKGSKKETQAEGLAKLREDLAKLFPDFSDRVDTLQDWNQIRALSVQLGRVKQWWKDGLLLIGDAAHVMSPVGGVGINYALMDAVAAANILTDPLKEGRLTGADLAKVQKRRELPTRIIQGIQSLAQSRIVAQALEADQDFKLPLPLRIIRGLPLLKRLPAFVIGRGFRSESMDI